MDGSFSSGSTYAEWEAKRRFTADLIDRDGTILDIGCASGFFLRSLQEWTGRNLTPFGVDVRPDLISVAQELFPKHSQNFAVLDVADIGNLTRAGLPSQYDFVFWNFLGRWDIVQSTWSELLRKILCLATRRVIVGFYGTNRYMSQTEEWRIERNRLLSLPATFKNAGFAFSGSKLNPTDFNQLVGWLDR